IGMPLEQFLEVCSSADLLLVRAAPLWVWRKEYEAPRRRAFIDVDPGFTQIPLANGDQGLADGIARCERRFTLGQRINSADCPIPPAGGPWLKTLPPVVLSEWPFIEGEATRFTSILRWQGLREVSYNGVAYGQRDQEFPRFLELPRMTSQKFRVAQLGIDPAWLMRHGWEVAPGAFVSRTPAYYRAFIQGSLCEILGPKNDYVKSRRGWCDAPRGCRL